ncbi:MAG: hypothetical protein AABX85_00010 [Nanoarchaeota archaeon]
MEKSIDDFWDTLKPKSFHKIDCPNKSEFILSQKTNLGYLNVTMIKERRYLFFPVYTLLITNKEPATERDAKVFHKNAPGHVTTARTFYRFRKAIGIHLAAINKLNRIGY